MPKGNVGFGDVKTILDNIISTWTAGNGGPPNLKGAHGPSFSWDTKQALLAAFAKGKPLIQGEVIGQAGQGRKANLIIDLTTGLNPFPRMPLGGLDANNGQFLDPAGPEISTLVSWIESGCPD